MPGSTRNTTRILIAFAVMVAVGIGAYFLWPKTDADALEQAKAARAEMVEAKEQALEAGGPAVSRTTFSRAMAAERRGKELQADADYSHAAAAYNRAARRYRRAQTAADSLAALAQTPGDRPNDSISVSPSARTAAQERADSMRTRMHVMQEAAVRAGSDSLAGTLHEQAVMTAKRARQAYREQTYVGYQRAASIFSTASELFRTAEERAEDRHAADIRRSTVNRLRADIDSANLTPPVRKLVTRAESLRTKARRAYDEQSFARAANLLNKSGMAYMHARSVSDSLREVEARASARAEFRSEAEKARRAMESVRQDIPEIQQHQRLYDQARGVEREAQRLYDREEYADAAEHFQKAARQYRAVLEMRIPLDRARDIVHELVGRYQQALEEKNVYQLRELLPGVDSQYWSSFFENASNLMASVNAGTLERTDDGATVTIRVSIDFMDEKNRMDHETFRSVWTLKPDDGDWMISSASMR